MALTPRWVTRRSMLVTLVARAVTSAHRDPVVWGLQPPSAADPHKAVKWPELGCVCGLLCLHTGLSA